MCLVLSTKLLTTHHQLGLHTQGQIITASFAIGQNPMCTDISRGGVVKSESRRLSWPLLRLLIDPRLHAVFTCLKPKSRPKSCQVCNQPYTTYRLRTDSYHLFVKGLFGIWRTTQSKKTGTNLAVLTSR